jgi:hypothetical protein
VGEYGRQGHPRSLLRQPKEKKRKKKEKRQKKKGERATEMRFISK